MTTIDRAEVKYAAGYATRESGTGTYKGPIRFMPGGHVALFPEKAEHSAFGEPTVLGVSRVWQVTILDAELPDDQAGLNEFEGSDQMAFTEDAKETIASGEKTATVRSDEEDDDDGE